MSREGCDLTQILTGSFWGQSRSREVSKETLTLMRSLVAWPTRIYHLELVVDLVSVDWLLDMIGKYDVQEDPRFGLEHLERR